MALYKDEFRIETTRLKGYDYSSPGEYFVTICTQGLECVFGEITGDEIQFNEYGSIAKRNWEKLSQQYSHLQLDEFIIMPNHVHGIIILCENNHRRDAINRVSTGGITKTHNPMLARDSLSNIIRQYKSRVSYEIHKIQPDFAWQPRFYERIIRDEKELNNIRNYIVNNPAKWSCDEENFYGCRGTSPHASTA
jgi:putative transposase